MSLSNETIGAMITVFVALLGYAAGRYQAKTERLRLRHELYDRRMKLFRGVMVLLSHVLQQGKVDLPQIFEFNAATQESYFLFGKDIYEYMRTLHVRAVDLRTVGQKLAQQSLPVGEERSRLADNESELLKWFGEQFDVAREKFSKHMSLAE